MSARIFTLFSSSKGNCTYIENGRDKLLIDAGVSARAISNALAQIGVELSDITAMFITHEHSDHIKGLDTLTKHFTFPIYAPPACCESIVEKSPYACELILPTKEGSVTELHETAVYSVETPHDSLGSVGFRIKAGDEIIGYFTDIGCLTEKVLRALSGCKRIVIESNHDIGMLVSGPYPRHLKERILSSYGHLSNADCSKLLPHLASYGTESVILAHLSEENNRPELAFGEAKARLEEKGVAVGRDIRLAVAAVCGICELK